MNFRGPETGRALKDGMKTKIKIALIRGWFLNKWEMMRYEPLSREFDLCAIGTHHPLFDISTIRMDVTKLHWPGEFFYLLGQRPAKLINRGLYKYSRYNQWLFGLENAIKDYDILHVADTLHLFSLQAARIKQKYRKKLVLTVWENIPFQDEKRSVYRSISREVINQTDRFLPVTQRSKEMLLIEGVPEEKITVIPQPVDLTRFTPKPKNDSLRETLGFSRGDAVIIFVGRLHKSKGLDFLLYAMKRLYLDDAVRSSVKLLIIGTGERERAYKELAARLSIDRQVVWCGEVNHYDLPAYYAEADIFVLPSVPLTEWQEQFGMVLIEAMACGKPVISTLSGSIPDVVGDAGILVQPADFHSLYQAIKYLLLTPGLRSQYGEKARKRAESEFSTDRIAEETARIYRKLAMNKGTQNGA